MNKLITLFFSMLIVSIAYGQNSLVRLDAESGRFKNLDYLPCCSKLTVEGEVAKNVVLVELAVAYEGTDKQISTSAWHRTIHNNSEAYEIQLQEALAPNSSYDFSLRTFTKLDKAGKENLKKNLLSRIRQFLKQNITLEKDKISVDNSNKVFKQLNTVIESAIFYQRSLSGIDFNGLSDMVKSALNDLNSFSVKNRLRKKKGDEKIEVSDRVLNDKINGMVELIYSEIYPFLASELAQQNNEILLKGVDTEKVRSTLPINAGVYGFTFTQKAESISEKNSGILPGVGVTIPFSRPFKVKNFSLGEFGLSFGVLLNSIKAENGVRYGIPGINLPVYAGLGFKTLKIVRINAGTLFTTDLANSSKLVLMPTIGINIELNLWLGIKRY